MIDQGANDPRLKGYKTPEGIKVEIVAEGPALGVPLAMTFADDGTPYVLERQIEGKKLVLGESDLPLQGREQARRIEVDERRS